MEPEIVCTDVENAGARRPEGHKQEYTGLFGFNDVIAHRDRLRIWPPVWTPWGKAADQPHHKSGGQTWSSRFLASLIGQFAPLGFSRTTKFNDDSTLATSLTTPMGCVFRIATFRMSEFRVFKICTCSFVGFCGGLYVKISVPWFQNDTQDVSNRGAP